jgi:acyl-CoA synthetase (NDP forming)
MLNTVDQLEAPLDKLTKFILEPQAIQMLKDYQIPYPAYTLAHDAREAVQIADRIGYPVVMKIVSKDAVHKSDVGGVIVNLANSEQVADAFQKIIENVHSHHSNADVEGILVVQQAAEGIEIIVGAMEDPTFGPTIMFGLGGIFAEVLKDVTFRIAPLERQDAEEMVREIKGYPLFTGLRGNNPVDITAIVDLLMAVSKLLTDHPEINELDLNPVRVYEQGLLVLDARMMEKTNT